MDKEIKKEAEGPLDQPNNKPADPVKEKKVTKSIPQIPDYLREDRLNEEATREANNEEELDKI